MQLPPDTTVRKFLYDGRPNYTWSGRIVERSVDLLVLAAYFNREKRELGYVTFEPGDLFIEFYYLDRWYNVFQIYSGLGTLKGWYCSISRPATVADGEVHFTDLALDLFAYPDGTSVPLDVEEFEEYALGTYSAEDTAQARAAFEQLLALHSEGRLPGRPFPGPAGFPPLPPI
jgi:protein associated with RNAse G/E